MKKSYIAIFVIWLLVSVVIYFIGVSQIVENDRIHRLAVTAKGWIVGATPLKGHLVLFSICYPIVALLFLGLILMYARNTINSNFKKEMHYQERNCGEYHCGTCRNIPYGLNEPKKKRKR